MDQMLKEYISLPEREVPSTPLLTKTNPPQAELNDDSQKEQENIAKTNNQISLRSPRDSNCSTSAILTKGDKATRTRDPREDILMLLNKLMTAYQLNLVGNYFSTLDEYQMMNRIHFSNINKKRITEN
jgi:hypothetical protein